MKPKEKNFKIVAADRRKLQAALAAAGTDMAEISVELGHTESYLSCQISKYGGIAESIARFLQKYYGVMYDAYKPDKPAKQAASQAEPEKASGYTITEESLIEALKKALDSYAWKEAIAKTVRFVLREEPTEDMLKRIIAEAIEEKLK